ncbi:cobalamin B12-binding domain-containing protein [Dehalobacterium formicoaceticum]|uniref:Corrinoid protein n=1 Tax=Dehalobacterium formicoaceticum TaxID=51515 RepID=A0ABT1Y5S5_9FIRM|nr:corrinoid protein [Dehalobacterium formicoaceticum]MCR6545036.1 corrinoid protein [Dehalobacterium formicoaceticum]
MSYEYALIQEALLEGKANVVRDLTKDALSKGIEPMTVLEKGLLPGMRIISEKFKNNQVYISDVLIVSRAMHAGLHVLKPILSEAQQSLKGRVVIGTVAGDLHDIGKNLVVMMMRGAGLDVIDLGVDVQPEDYVQAVVEYHPDVLAMSAMLTTTMGVIPETIQELEQKKLRDRIKIVVGGGPTTKDFADKVKADGYAAEATEVADLMERILSDH